MTKTMAKTAAVADQGEAAERPVVAKLAQKTLSNKGKVVKTYRGAKVAGVTTDGVKILKGIGRPTHFTLKEIRAAIASVRAARKEE
jgi:hypothetical protein